MEIAGVVSLVFVGDGQTDTLGLVGEGSGSLAQEVVDLAANVPHAFFDRDLFGDGEVFFFHELFDVELESSRGGDAARGNVGLAEVAGATELDHLVSDGGRRDAQIVFAVEHFGADCLGGVDVFFDDNL
jgi:hypothetical protein